MTTAPNDPSTLYVVERAGDVRIVRDGESAGVFLDIRSQVWSEGEGGLLSIAFHPKYAQNHRFYVDYTDLAHRTHVTEYSSAGGVAVPSSARDLLVVPQPYPNHKGGDLQFDRLGRLYVGMGDGGTNPDSPVLGPRKPRAESRNQAREAPSHRPAWFRALAHGRLRTAQPVALLVRSCDRRPLARRRRRRQLRRARLPSVQDAERSSTNFGWSSFEGPAVYNPKVKLRGKGKLVVPVLSYNHDTASCSIIGGYVYRGTQVGAARGRYFFGDFCSGFIWSFKAGAQYRRARLFGSSRA